MQPINPSHFNKHSVQGGTTPDQEFSALYSEYQNQMADFTKTITTFFKFLASISDGKHYKGDPAAAKKML